MKMAYSNVYRSTLTALCMFLYIFKQIESAAHHPMLYFTENDIAKMRHKAKTTHVKIAKVIEESGRSLKDDAKLYLPPESFEKFGSRWNELYGNNLCAFAMYCVLFPEDSMAFELVSVYMERMTTYPDWYVTASRNRDQVPIGHSLTGYVTAFDFLYERFSQDQRKRFLKKIGVETKRMYDIIKGKRAGWVKQHIHNHAPTNVLATLLGAMVYQLHFPNLNLPWKQISIDLMEKAMKIFWYVIDGSCDEGVAYGSYTSRGVTQYIYLALRHFGKDHTNNPWLRQHFWFFYATVMPGYQRSVGIADSNHNWFYGPESQLVFLDAFVMRNGYGNWLADRVRSAKPKNPPLARAMSQKWSTVHTEFIFYDASIKAVRPVLPNNTSFHIFSDWGVVTVGGGQYLKKGNTFLSFKSGPIHGEAVADIVDYGLLSNFIQGWSNFNPGHEHPDQNSFVFAPNGRYFITEALYAPKHTFLNNVLTFASSPESKCNNPWEGQIGECSKWLNYKFTPVPRGKIVSVAASGSLVHIVGEAVASYRKELGLESVQRSLLLLHPEVLLVVDSVYLGSRSGITRASAYFHNVLHSFHPYRQAGYQGAQVIYPEGPYAFFWVQSDGKSPSAQLHNQANDAEYKQRMTNFVNVTFQLHRERVNRIAFAFVGPSVRVSSLFFLKESNEDVALIEMVINNVVHKISVSSAKASLTTRMKYLGFGGYARVEIDDEVTLIGANYNSLSLDRCSITDDESAFSFVRSLVISRNISVGISHSTDEETTSSTPQYVGFRKFVIGVVILTCMLLWLRRRKIRWKQLFFMVLVWLILSWYLLCKDCDQIQERTICSIRDPIESDKISTSPRLIIVSLPGSGSELLETLFQNSSEFLYLSQKDTHIPTVKADPNKFDSCHWPISDSNAITAGWFKVLFQEPMLLLNNVQDHTPRIEFLRRKFRHDKKKSRFVVNLFSGFWNTKLHWLQHVVGDDLRLLVVVRDPRDWVFSLLRDDLTEKQQMRQQFVRKSLLSNVSCHPPSFDWNFKHSISANNQIESLARIWSASVSTMLRQGRGIRIVRYEDLIYNSEYASGSILRWLGMTISVPDLNRLIRASRSGEYFLEYEGPISSSYLEKWKSMKQEDIVTIEKLCGKLMKQLGYL